MNGNKTRAVIIVAGGKGIRMGVALPKQFLPVGGVPVLMRTIRAFHTFDTTMQIVLVLPAEQQEFWYRLCLEHDFNIPCVVADGGDTRFQSVKNGLMRVEADWVAVHDGVRPFVSHEVIKRCFELAELKKAVVPVVDVVETVRELVSDGSSRTVNRDQYKLVQTPQVFETDLLRRAYAQNYTPAFTDDASVVEALGVQVALTAGNRENIKITTPFDLQIGEALV